MWRPLHERAVSGYPIEKKGKERNGQAFARVPSSMEKKRQAGSGNQKNRECYHIWEPSLFSFTPLHPIFHVDDLVGRLGWPRALRQVMHGEITGQAFNDLNVQVAVRPRGD